MIMTTTSKYTKTNLQSILSAGPVEIKFTKKDGTVNVLCLLQQILH